VTPESSGRARYGYAVLCVGIALVAALALHNFDLEGFIFVIAVAVAVWLGGRGPGALAVVLSILVLHYVFIAPSGTGAPLSTYAYFVVFAVLAALITTVTEARHRAERSLREARDTLETKVRQRTAELELSRARLAHFDGVLELLSMIWARAPLRDVLVELATLVESQGDGMRCAIWLLDHDGRHMRAAAAPTMAPEYIAAIDGWEPTPTIGACGAAIARGESVYIADVLTDPLGESQRDLALRHDIRATLSSPILAPDQRVLGTFCVYFAWRRSLDPTVQQLIESASRLAGIAIESRRAEEELRRSEAFLAEGQRLTHTGSWTLNLADGSMRWSRELFSILGVDPADGAPTVEQAWSLYHPDDRPRIETLFLAAVADKADYVMDSRIVLPDGSLRHVEVVGHAVLDDAGRLVEYVGTTMDVTERHAAEYQIRKQATLLHLAHDAVIVVDPDRRITYWNHGAEETYGWTAEEAQGCVIDTLLQTSFGTTRETLERETRETGAWEGELVQCRRNGREIVVASRWSLLRDEHGTPTATLEINRDISDSRRTDEALRTLRAQLAHVTRVSTLGEVAASLAHEVNQPLGAIANNANACLGLLPDACELRDVREALVDIVSDAERASSIIDRVRLLVRRTEPERTRLRLTDVVTDTVALARPEAAARRVALCTQLDADLPSVVGDRVQLQQVLLNLVVNGMDAMNGAPVVDRHLDVRVGTQLRDGMPSVVVRVRDSGGGVQPEQMERLFEPFYTTKPNGMGMGLAISRSIIEAHGGRLWAEPNQDTGSTFAFTLPAAPS